MIKVKFEVSSNLKISPDQISELLTMIGVNTELSPFISMTAPSQWVNRPIFEWPAGQVLFSSWILLFGIIPIDRHTFFFQSIDGNSGFSEESSSFTNKLWHHRRRIDWGGANYRVTDTIEFESRLPVLTNIFATVYRFIFRHRHKVLRSRHEGKAS
jgi:hypothetical protein